jgi:hypothetical protein
VIEQWRGWDLVRHGNKNLVVTIGESWTWGDSLGNTRHNVYDDREFRLDNVYGAHLARRLNADFLNIAKPGESNLWITDHLNWAKEHVHTLGYDKVYWFVTLTEVGREFNGDRDHLRVYTDLLKNIQGFNDFIDQLSMLIAQELSKHPDVIIATNFVGNNYPDWLPVLQKTWVDIIAEYNKQPAPDLCFVVLSWVYERFSAVFEFNPDLDRSTWLKQILEHMKKSDQVTNLLLASPINYKKASKHPTPIGHEIWANYLFAQLPQSV